MAEAFFNGLSRTSRAESAGTRASEGEPLHENVIRCMREAGYDVSGKRRRQLTAKMVAAADRIIVLCERSETPQGIAADSRTEFWDVPDAKDRSYEEHAAIRDRIRAKVVALVEAVG